jgi:hypothetical protein
MWTSLIIKEQEQNKTNPKVEFRMLVIKPHLCAWLFHAWLGKNKPTSNFNLDFHMEASKVNATKKLFS